ncbi:MAG: GNAT family N-acetyltransferase [Rhodanobacteraceae bacterium]|nr:MAG: GNAT family N-acetyltransferase [Rhodanobacteraceae bacterium]
MPTLRKAVRDDAEQLSRLAERAFRETFGPANTPENMDLHCRSSYDARIQADEISNPKMVTFLGEEADKLVGFAQLRWGDAPDCVVAESPGEILRLYVLSDWHGKGIAQSLMQACLDEMKARGSDVVWLGVWEHNPRAISFYRKFGFAEVGDHVFPVGSDPQRDIVMARVV